jgi:hypothetical protein
MNLDDLTFECAPMRARFSQHECERQIATRLLDRLDNLLAEVIP